MGILDLLGLQQPQDDTPVPYAPGYGPGNLPPQPDVPAMNPLVKQAVLDSASKRAPATDIPSPLGGDLPAPVSGMDENIPDPSATQKFGLDFGQDAYDKAKDASHSNNGLLAILQGLSGVGDAIAGRSPSTSAQTFDQIRKNQYNNTLGDFLQKKQQAVSDISTNKALALQDPNSDQSKVVQQTVSKLYPGTFSPEQIKNLTADDSNLILKPLELKAKLDEAKAVQGQKLELQRSNTAEKQGKASEQYIQKLSASVDKGLSTPMVGRSGEVGKAQGKVNAAERAQALLDQAKTQPGGLDSRQIEELAQSTSAILGSGTSASARVEALVPHTLFGRAQTLNEYLSNNPKGQGMQAFTNRLADTISREKAVAQDQVNKYLVEGTPGLPDLMKVAPDQANAKLMRAGIDPSSVDEHGRYKRQQATQAAQSHPQDDAAVSWAKANPNDPRSAQILKANGVQ